MTNTSLPPVDIHLSIGAHVLHALPVEEADAFDEHLSQCATCSEEIGGLRAVAAMLGAAEAVRPPAALRDRVLQAAARTPQEPPQLRSVGGGNAGSAAARPTHRKASVWYRRPGSWLAAAAAIAIIAGGITAVSLSGRQAPLTAGQQIQQCVVADHTAATLTPSVGDGGSLTRSDSCGAVMVTLPAMPAPPKGKGYQIWMVKDGQPISMGMVPSISGAIVPLKMTDGDTAVAVTVEPSAGSEKPTGDPIWSVPLH